MTRIFCLRDFRICIRWKWILFSLFYQLVHFSYGQEVIFDKSTRERFTITQFSTDHDLKQNTIKQIATDSFGFLWISTEFGLARFDGNQFEYFTTDNSLLQTNRVSLQKQIGGKQLYVRDDKGNLFGILNGYLSEGVNGKRFVHPGQVMNSNQARLKNEFIGSVTKEGNNQLSFFLDTGKGYVCYPEESLIVYYDKGKRSGIIHTPFKLFDNHWGKGSAALVEDHLVSITNKYELVEVKKGKWAKKHNLAELVGEKVVHCQFLNTGIQHAYLMINKSIYQVDLKDGLLDFRLLLSGINGSKHVNAFYVDSRNNYYLGSSHNGLFRLTHKNFFSSFDVFSSRWQSYRNLIEISPGVLLTGTGDIINLRTLRIEGRKTARQWIFEKKGAGLNLYYEKGHSYYLKKEGQPDQEISRLPPPNVKCIRQDEQRNYWIASAIGFFKQEKDGGTIKNYTRFIKDTGELWLHNLEIDQVQKDKLYLCTNEGLYIFNSTTNQSTLLRGTEDAIVRSVYQDRDKNLWICSYDKGLLLFHKGILYQIGKRMHESLQSVHTLVQDSLGLLWISTNSGLFRFSPRALVRYAKDPSALPYCEIYDQAQGMATSEFNGAGSYSGIQLQDGRIAFASIKGVMVFNPQNLQHWPAPSVHISLEKDRHTLKYDTFYELNYEYEQLVLDVKVPNRNLASCGPMTYYMLEGYGKSWLPVDPMGKVIFSRLSPGQYTFKVRHIYGFAPDQMVEQSIQIVVLKTWYHTFLFKLVILSAIILLGFGFMQFRIRLLKRKKAHLEEEVAQKTIQLRDKVSQLTSSERQIIKQLRLKNQFMGIISHDVIGTLKHMELVSTELSKESTKKNYSYIQQMQAASKELSHRISQILAWVKGQGDDIKPQLARVNLNEVIKEMLHRLNILGEEKGVYFTYRETGAIQFISDIQMIQSILQNLLENEVKHGQNTKISISTSQNEAEVKLEILNTGSSIRYIEAIHQFFNSNGEGVFGKGLGLRIIKTFIYLLNIKISYDRPNENAHRVLLVFQKKDEREE